MSQPLTLPVHVVMEEAAVVSKTGPPPLVVERIEYDSPAAETVELQTITPESRVLPPPGFPPFLFPENDGGMDADEDRRSLSIRWGLGVPSGTPHTVFRTMRSRRESTDS